MNKKINVLELNNIDVYGKRFNGFSIQEYINKNPSFNINAKFLVNHKLGDNTDTIPLFKNKKLEVHDWQIDAIESHIGTKNQISISKQALINHSLYKKADILHFHMFHNMHLPIEFLLQVPAEKKIILDLHDTFWLTDKNIPMLEAFQASNVNKNSLISQRERILNSIDATIVVHSPYMYNLCQTSSATKHLPIININFGINLNIFKPFKNPGGLRKKYNIPQNNIVFFFRAQNEFKGLNYIIEALSNLKTHHKITVITVGEKNLCKALEKKYQVIDFGLIDDEKFMAKLYNLCDIFLAPSTEESFGFMAIEAMACAKPIIVFEGTALPHTTAAPKIGISTKRSSKELSKAILYLIDNKGERLSRGKAGTEFAKKTYNEHSYLKENVKLYQELYTKPKRKITPQNNNNKKPNPDFNSIANKVKDAIINNYTKELSPKIIDYDNAINQVQLSAFNQDLYYTLSKTSLSEKTKDLASKICPKKVKKIIRRFYDK